MYVETPATYADFVKTLVRTDRLVVAGIFGPDTPVKDVTTKRIDEYAAWRKTDVRDTTVNRELSTLRTMFDKAVDWRFIEASSAKSVKELPDDSATPRALFQVERI